MLEQPRQESAESGGAAREGVAPVPGSEPSQRVCRGGAALALTERILCGSGAVGTAAAAEGLALSGVRAARLLADEEVRLLSHAAAAVPWVLHRTTLQRARGNAFGAFELVASTAQEACDQALVAHMTALAGELLVHPGFERELWLIQPLSEDQVAPLFSEAASRERLVTDEDAVGRELGIAFEKVAAKLGRAIAPLTRDHSHDAEVVIVTTADAREVALAASASLGVRCAVVSLAQLRPFPSKALVEAVSGKRVAVLEAGWMRGRLEPAVRAALGVNAQSLPTADPFGANPISSLRAALGFPSQEEAVVPASSPRFVIGVVPAGARAEALLGDIAARLAQAGSITIAEPDGSGAASLIAVGRGAGSLGGQASIDLLLAADPVLLDPSRLETQLAEAGTVVIASAADSAQAVWSELSAAQRDVLRRRSARIQWLDTRQRTSELDAPNSAWLTLGRALIEASAPAVSKRLGLDEKRVRSLAGEPALVAVEPTATTVARAARTTKELPVMPAGVATSVASSWRTALRKFHVTGEGAAGAAALLPLAPAAVSAWLARGVEQQFPLLVDLDSEPAVVPFITAVSAAASSAGAVIAEHLPRFVASVAHELAEAKGPAPVAVTLERALARFAREFELSAAAKKSFDGELANFRRSLPVAGRLLGLSQHVHLELYARVVLAERARRTSETLEQIKRLASALGDRIRIEAARSPKARSAEGVGSVLGEGAAFIDQSVLARTLPATRGPRPLDDDRRRRIERAHQTLQRFLAELPTASELVVVHHGSVPDDLELGRAERIRHGDCFEVACGLFDGTVLRFAEVFRAARVARLELDGAYDEAVHGASIAALEWTGFSEEELLLVPPIVVVESADRVWKSSLDSLSRLLRSGRPIHVLVEESLALSGQPGLGYVLVAHREAIVLQATLARPQHFSDGLARMAVALRPAVVLVAPRPVPGPIPAWLELGASLEGRALPPFSYDPDQGGSWAECFDIGQNPRAELAWPTSTLEIQSADGTAGKLEVTTTFADAAALSLEMRGHFWLIPREAWSDEQVELAPYLTRPANDLTHLPFIWVVGEDGQFARAVVSRELAFACRERLRIWHVIQELGGADNEHARRAADAARHEAESEALRAQQALEASHQAELERVRNEEASTALRRLAEALLNPGALAAPAATAPPATTKSVARVGAPPPTPDAAAAASPPAPAPVVEEEVVSFSDPYIDTPLCTSCNECLNVNPLMFKYNGDKQAVLADAKAGTFLQLVRAAEKCPAACIHPGEPRKDDKTVDADLLARAARFN